VSQLKTAESILSQLAEMEAAVRTLRAQASVLYTSLQEQPAPVQTKDPSCKTSETPSSEWGSPDFFKHGPSEWQQKSPVVEPLKSEWQKPLTPSILESRSKTTKGDGLLLTPVSVTEEKIALTKKLIAKALEASEEQLYKAMDKLESEWIRDRKME